MATDPLASAEAQKNWFEKLTERVPGYAGYADRERRRDADKTLRMHVAGKIDAARAELAQAKLLLTDQGKLSGALVVDRIEKKAAVLSDKIRLASYGYSGVFDSQKIGEKELAALYAFDGGLFDGAVGIAKLSMDVVSKASAAADPAESCAAVDRALLDLDRAFSDRGASIER